MPNMEPQESLSPASDTALASAAQEPVLPRLPPELLLQILLSPPLSPTLHPSPLTYSTLQSLLYTSRLAHACARQQLYEVLILPRHVREFRKYYDRERQKGWPGAGVTRGYFSALEDVSRLTHTSAGWETAFLRMLHMLGPAITHLSLWHSESRTLLRDAGQVQERGRDKPRIGALGPSWSWGEGEIAEDDANSDSASEDEGGSTDDEDGERISPSMPSLSSADIAALRERGRQQMPTWLRRELEEASSPAEVARRHRAHLLPFGDPDRHFALADASNGVSHAADALHEHMVQETRKGRDRRRIKGCRPRCLSLILSLPLFENQEPRLFASLMVLSRCEELDCFFPVPAHAPRLLGLLAHLRRSPLRRLKISSTHFSLVMAVPPFSRAQEREMRAEEQRHPKQRRGHSSRASKARDGDARFRPRGPNLALVLRNFLENEAMRSALHWEFAGKHVDVPEALERELTSVANKGAAKQYQSLAGHGGQQRDGTASGAPAPYASNSAASTSLHTLDSVAGGPGTSAQSNGADADDGFPAVLSKLLALDDDYQAEASKGEDGGLHSSSPPRSASPNGVAALQQQTPPQSGLQYELPHEVIRIRIFQRNQGKYGRLKDRREDFIERSMGGEGVWEKCGVWEGDD